MTCLDLSFEENLVDSWRRNQKSSFIIIYYPFPPVERCFLIEWFPFIAICFVAFIFSVLVNLCNPFPQIPCIQSISCFQGMSRSGGGRRQWTQKRNGMVNVIQVGKYNKFKHRRSSSLSTDVTKFMKKQSSRSFSFSWLSPSSLVYLFNSYSFTSATCQISHTSVSCSCQGYSWRILLKVTTLTRVCPPYDQPPLALSFFHTPAPKQWLCPYADSCPSSTLHARHGR